MPPSSVPSPSFSPTGFVAPQEAAVLLGVAADWNSAFGGNLNAPTIADPGQGLSTPQGQLITTETAIIADKNTRFLEMANNFDPQYSVGRYQDALGYIYFMTRAPATPTLVVCTCGGLPGTLIPFNSQAIDTAGNIYLCQTGGVIGLGGTVSLIFLSQTTGPIACPAGTLNQIYITIPGWNTITNPADGTIGRVVETQQAFEYRRQASVALNGTGALPSISAAVWASFPAGMPTNVPTDVYVTENVTGAPVTVKGISIAAHSLYVAAAGGDSTAIATAIWTKKSPGCNYTGTTTINVPDTVNYSVPYPTYAVSYTIPTALPIYFAVTITNVVSLPADIAQRVQNAIIAAWAGLDGGPRMAIAYDVAASRFFAPVSQVSPLVIIQTLFVGTAPSPASAVVTVNLDKLPTISAANISVTLV